MTRVEGWEKILNKYIEETAHKHFSWGDCDCLIFASDACKIVSGIDPMKKKKSSDPETIRGMYDSRDGAYTLIKKYRRSVPNIMDVHFLRVHPSFAQRGDIVLAKIEGPTFGICWGGKAFFKTQTEGYYTLPLGKCKYAWRVE
jgi:hypothetical protein